MPEPCLPRAPFSPPAPRSPNGNLRPDWALQMRSGTSSKRSTSTSPRSVIFRCGITDSARKDSVRNGVAPDQPSRSRRLVAGAALGDHVVERRIGEQPRDGERALGEHLAAADRDDASAELGEAGDRERHVVVAHPHDDEVVRVVGDGRGQRAALQARAARRTRARCARWRDAARRRRSSPGRARRRQPRAPSTTAGSQTSATRSRPGPRSSPIARIARPSTGSRSPAARRA